VLIRTVSLPIGEIGYDEKEILRYAGSSKSEVNSLDLLRSCVCELGPVIREGRACFCELPVSVRGDEVTLGPIEVRSSDLAKNLGKCESCILFAATVGIETDRLISRYSRISISRAHMLQAIGAERIERLCDELEKQISAERPDKSLRPRFSPGYGDLDISFQKEIFALLDCPRRIGLSLSDSMIMSPSKSVSAIVGLCKK
jgi:hypothetical protein